MRVHGWMVAVGLVAMGCSTDTTGFNTSFGSPPTAGADAGGGAGSGPMAGTGASNLPPSNVPIGGSSAGGAGGGSGGAGGEGPCAAESAEAKRIERVVEFEVVDTITTAKPVALYIVIDRSGSMRGQRWNAAIQATQSFVSDPRSEGLDVALSYFPHNDADWTIWLSWIPGFGPTCDGADYVRPRVPLGRLPDHAAMLQQSLTTTQPNGNGTPIEPALRGMTQYCIDFQSRNPDQPCVGVFVSDGAPAGCSADHAVLTGIVEAAYRDHGVRTFSIGIDGADFGLMNNIGRLGGTDCDPNGPSYACDARLGDGLADALHLIRETVTETVTRTETRIETEIETLDCEFNLPVPPPDKEFDKDQVNLVFSEPGAEEINLGRVDAEADCEGLSQLAWHYDDLAAPGKILVCPQTCEHLQASAEGRMEVQLGCETEIILK
jgi:hypothetical protein